MKRTAKYDCHALAAYASNNDLIASMHRHNGDDKRAIVHKCITRYWSSVLRTKSLTQSAPTT